MFNLIVFCQHTHVEPFCWLLNFDNLMMLYLVLHSSLRCLFVILFVCLFGWAVLTTLQFIYTCYRLSNTPFQSQQYLHHHSTPHPLYHTQTCSFPTTGTLDLASLGIYVSTYIYKRRLDRNSFCAQSYRFYMKNISRTCIF